MAEGDERGQLRVETRLTRLGRGTRSPGGPLNVPIVAASNFHAGATLGEAREYAREDATVAWEAFEELLGDLEGGRGVCFSSGMAAIAAVLELLPVGARVVVPRDCYGGTRTLLADGHDAGRWQVTVVDVTAPGELAAAVADADLVWLETPSNPLMEIVDLAEVVGHARAAGARVVVDNTFATPLECFLALRGARTLALRLRHAQEAAGQLARRLHEHPQATRVRYPGLPDDPFHAVAAAQMAGFGAVLSVEVADAATADALVAAVQVVTAATSLGGVESTIERRAKLPGQGHVPPGLLRLSVGCEHLEDLWDDLDRALTVAAGAAPS